MISLFGGFLSQPALEVKLILGGLVNSDWTNCQTPDFVSRSWAPQEVSKLKFRCTELGDLYLPWQDYARMENLVSHLLLKLRAMIELWLCR